uniref:3-hydroxy-3-methylglutaryl coenzyme A reductase n=1 Tax=Phallusia mammillata TaxID=59560 RepID=A0A6F9DF86_9ASCI|nr:3-hydroxy-3-methylglutaryl-coenzyme A reductase-like [Phallusia mammillata]
MSVKLFEWYGKFCAAYALEVIVFFLTTVVGAITLNISSPHELCHWAVPCTQSQTEVSSDVVLLTVLRCGTIIYTYMKLKNIWKVGSIFVVGIVCTYTVFSVITFTITLVHFLHKDLVIVSSALPVFLLLIDLSRMTVLTKHCLSVHSIDMLQDYIAEGMGTLAPVLTLDTLVELLLLVNVGGYVQIRQLQQLSCFACLSVIINYIVFSTFVPACLSVLLSVVNKNSQPSANVMLPPSWHDNRFSHTLQDEKGTKKQLFTTRFKVIICLPLFVMHWFRYSIHQGTAMDMQKGFDSVLTLTPEQFFTVILIILLSSKYLLDDGFEIFRRPSLPKITNTALHIATNKPQSNVLSNKRRVISDVDLDTSKCMRPTEKCLELLSIGSDLLSDAEIISLVKAGKLAVYKLESTLQDANRGVSIRRKITSQKLMSTEKCDALNHIPFTGYDFTKATKACCENTIGYVPVPVGIVGPLLLDGQEYMIPMATTEGTLLASTNRGLKALFKAGGVSSCVYADGMSRAPVVQFPTSEKACHASMWLKETANFELVKEKFDETSRFARLQGVMPVVSGRYLFIRFVATTGDAMGMNMLSKGAENALRWIQHKFPDMQVVSISGNFCTDKKPSAVNWILGRGKSVVCEASLPKEIIKTVLKTDIQTLVHLNRCKNHIGSAMSGSMGGFNAHAANIVTAMFIATGQDPAQTVVSSNCITTLEIIPETGNITSNNHTDNVLLITCTMPSLEVATVGGGSSLDPQNACLKLLGVAGSSAPEGKPGDNATRLAKIICATVLAGELSLLSALDSGDLVQSHMKHNRLPKNITVQESDHQIL